MRSREKIDTRKLTAQQNYLLGRIPYSHDLDGYKPTPEPAAIKLARKRIARWDAGETKKQCQARKRNEALLRKAKEAVYFESPEKALAIVRQCEKMLKGCPL